MPLRDEQSYTLEDLKSYHCDQVKWMPIADIDPSMAVGFYFDSIDEFEDFIERSKLVSVFNQVLYRKESLVFGHARTNGY